MSEENITKLPVKFKPAGPTDRTLLQPYEVGKRTCYHEKFVIDPTLATVECGACHEKLDPMWVLGHLCNRDGTFARAHDRYADEMKRLDERSRTKCRHCGKLTEISRS